MVRGVSRRATQLLCGVSGGVVVGLVLVVVCG